MKLTHFRRWKGEWVLVDGPCDKQHTHTHTHTHTPACTYVHTYIQMHTPHYYSAETRPLPPPLSPYSRRSPSQHACTKPTQSCIRQHLHTYCMHVTAWDDVFKIGTMQCTQTTIRLCVNLVIRSNSQNCLTTTVSTITQAHHNKHNHTGPPQ